MSANALDTPLTRHARIEVPLIGGAMYPCGNPELVAAVSEADGIGKEDPGAKVGRVEGSPNRGVLVVERVGEALRGDVRLGSSTGRAVLRRVASSHSRLRR